MITKKILFITIALAVCQSIVKAQQIVDCKQTGEIWKTKEKYDRGWDYTSIDIYLINPENLGNILLESDTIDIVTRRFGKPKKTSKRDYIKYLYLSLGLPDNQVVRDIEVPLFLVDLQDKNIGTIYKNDHKRVIDKHPTENLSQSDLNSDIKLQTIVGNRSNEIFDKILDLTLEIIKDPVKITNNLSLVTSLGKMAGELKKGLKEKSFSFTWTIRLFDNTSFEEKLYSAKLYAIQRIDDNLITPATLDLTKEFKTEDEIINSIEEPQLTYVLIVNKISAYKQIIAGEITFDGNYIAKRQANVDFNVLTTNQRILENEFTSFIKKGQELLEYHNSYIEKYQQTNKIDYFYLNKIAQTYYQIKSDVSKYDSEYKDNSAYTQYKELFIEGLKKLRTKLLDKNNTQISNLENYIESLIILESENKLSSKSNSWLEMQLNNISFYRNSILPQTKEDITLIISINSSTLQNQTDKFIKEIEDIIYANNFKREIEDLKVAKLNEEGKKIRNNLEEKTKVTNCKFCILQSQNSINNFDTKLKEKENKEEEVRNQFLESKNEHQNNYQNYLVNLDCIINNVELIPHDSTVSETKILLYNAIDNKKEELKSRIIEYGKIQDDNILNRNSEISKLIEFTNRLTFINEEIVNIIEFFRKKEFTKCEE